MGESGSGKTTLGRAVLGLAPVTGGRITFEGKDISHASRKERRTLSRDLQVVFQDPYTSLNPALDIGDILAEPLGVQGITGKAARERVRELLDQVGLPLDAIHRLPREFSGGQRQRDRHRPGPGAVSPSSSSATSRSARWTCPPRPASWTCSCRSSSDTGVSYLFVSHDLDVVRHISHRVAVMYRGEIVEQGAAAAGHRRPPSTRTPSACCSPRRCRTRTARPSDATPGAASPPRCGPPDGPPATEADAEHRTPSVRTPTTPRP